VGSHLISTGIGVASIVLAIVGGRLGPFLAGVVYFAMGPAHGIYSTKRAKRADAMHREVVGSGAS